MPRGEFVQSLQRGIRILAAVSESDNGLSLNEICSATGLRTTTAHNLVRTLAHEGCLARNGAPRYRLGPAVLSMVGQQRRTGVLKRMEAEVRRLHREFPRATVSYCESRNEDILVVMRMWADRPTVLERPEASTMTPYTTVTTLVFQAFWPPSRVIEYRRRFPLWEFGAHLWGTEDELAAELDTIRSAGFAVGSRGEGTLLVAAPVFGPGEDIVGVLGLRTDDVDGNTTDISSHQGARLIEAARAAAAVH